MITYNWSKVFKVSDAQPSEILKIIAYLHHKPIPENNYDPIKKYTNIDWSGNSFLLNPGSVLLNLDNASLRELAEYVALASFRNYAEYLVTKRKTLKLSECPVSLELLHKNRLLSVSGSDIYFCWEETTH